MMRQIGRILSSRLPRAVAAGVLGAQAVAVANLRLSVILGPKAADFAAAEYVKNRALCIHCRSSVTAQEIKLHEAELISFINQTLGGAAVKKIQYFSSRKPPG